MEKFKQLNIGKFYYESTGQKYSTFGIDIAISVA